MNEETLEGVQCEACGSYEFECRDEGYFCSSCAIPVRVEGKKAKPVK